MHKIVSQAMHIVPVPGTGTVVDTMASAAIRVSFTHIFIFIYIIT